ncbi:G protein alpha-subunit [Mycena albidolilacea]|uniref:G protein alpha-subunit n=1 Tax=Mycena albidolilacea TaxID=1033008 RepID=A0AAD7AQY2_9AGAR|nr:G protein alpha-subunit [Mycena albidolilacea]
MQYIQRSRANLKKENSRATARSEAIEIQLQQDSLLAKNEINVLLLGATGSEHWQSTLFRQMGLLHHPGYTARERDAYKGKILSDVTEDMRAVLEAMPKLESELSPTNDKRRNTILSLPPYDATDAPPAYSAANGNIADAIRGLWRDPSVREAVQRSCEFNPKFSDNGLYYFDSIDRIAAAGYQPTDQDILRRRAETTGIREIKFQVGEVTYKLFDPNGQWSDRRKWLHCFQDVKAILFCTTLSDYDQVLYEDESINHLQEALTIFDSVCNSQWFLKTSIMLFLNVDGLQEKLRVTPLADHFPDYTGGDDFEAACDYLLHRFVSLNQHGATKQIYVHYGTPTDNEQVKFFISMIQEILLQNYLREQGLL